MEKKPKIEIRVKPDLTETSRKLTFSTQSQEAARIRINQEKQREEKVPFQVLPYQNITTPTSSAPPTSTIYQKLFEPSKVPVEQISPLETENEQQEFVLEERQVEEYPYFPGIYPSLYRPDDALDHKSERHVPKEPLKTKDEVYLDLGPIYTEAELRTQGNEIDKEDRYRVRDGLKLTLAIIGAIGLGSLFGYLLLLFVLSGDGLTEPKEQSQISNNEVDRRVITADKVAIDLKQGGKVVMGKLTVTDRTFYAIQAGVFTEEKSGQEAFTGFKNKKLPILLFNDDVFRIFLGIGYQEQDAIQLSQFFKRLGTEIYLKKYTITGGTVTIPNASLAQMELLNQYFTHGTYLLEKTAAWSGEALQDRVHITEDAWGKFKDTHQAFLTEAQQLESFLPEEQKRWLSAMSKDMDQAVLAMAHFIEGQDREQFVISQQGLLNYFENYRSFLISTGVNITMK